MMMTMETLADLVPTLGYSDKHGRNIAGSVRTSAKVYQTELGRIEADLADFDARWGFGRISRYPSCFDTADQFRTWRKNVRAAIRRAHGHQQPTTLSEEWQTLLACVRENQGKSRPLGPNSDLTIGVVARVASAAGIAPHQLTSAWIDESARMLPSEPRKSFCRGIEGVNRVLERVPYAFSGFRLPNGPLPVPAALRTRPTSWTRAAKNPDATLVWADFDRIMEIRKFGEESPQIEGTPSGYKDSSVKSMKESVQWLLGCLGAIDLLQSGMDLSEAITHANLVAAINHWIAKRKARGLPSDKTTLHVHTSRLVQMALEHFDPSSKEAARLRKLRKAPAIKTKSVGRMSVAREEWIKEFDRDTALQAKVHQLPETLMQRAIPVLDRHDRGLAVQKSKLMMALRLGVAAAQTAILFRASPIRATNLRTLRMRGTGAELLCFDLVDDDRMRELRLKLPGAAVKNGADIDEVADDDLAPILRWYLTNIRSRLIKAHPFGKNCRDSDYLFPSTSTSASEASTFNRNFREGLLGVGIDMQMHQARHVTAYFILSVDPNGWDDAAAVLNIDVDTVRKHYGWLDRRKASEAGREKLRQARTIATRHRKGHFAE